MHPKQDIRQRQSTYYIGIPHRAIEPLFLREGQGLPVGSVSGRRTPSQGALRDNACQFRENT